MDNASGMDESANAMFVPWNTALDFFDLLFNPPFQWLHFQHLFFLASLQLLWFRFTFISGNFGRTIAVIYSTLASYMAVPLSMSLLTLASSKIVEFGSCVEGVNVSREISGSFCSMIPKQYALVNCNILHLTVSFQTYNSLGSWFPDCVKTQGQKNTVLHWCLIDSSISHNKSFWGISVAVKVPLERGDIDLSLSIFK